MYTLYALMIGADLRRIPGFLSFTPPPRSIGVTRSITAKIEIVDSIDAFRSAIASGEIRAIIAHSRAITAHRDATFRR
ncbi:hypothetical protein WM26_00655 [Burkholderia cepacia]|uniref:hypothetical protein n=1 Tax=Burkholderia cepacia TaxID=292 RepID=UPI00075FD584|nr:hypothetical protein [Burkholderia cepacia]KWO11032.1 hypothetical protein WM26_00655 [Burkholderia cepacia]